MNLRQLRTSVAQLTKANWEAGLRSNLAAAWAVLPQWEEDTRGLNMKPEVARLPQLVISVAEELALKPGDKNLAADLASTIELSKNPAWELCCNAGLPRAESAVSTISFLVTLGQAVAQGKHLGSSGIARFVDHAAEVLSVDELARCVRLAICPWALGQADPVLVRRRGTPLVFADPEADTLQAMLSSRSLTEKGLLLAALGGSSNSALLAASLGLLPVKRVGR